MYTTLHKVSLAIVAAAGVLGLVMAIVYLKRHIRKLEGLRDFNSNR